MEDARGSVEYRQREEEIKRGLRDVKKEVISMEDREKGKRRQER